MQRKMLASGNRSVKNRIRGIESLWLLTRTVSRSYFSSLLTKHTLTFNTFEDLEVTLKLSFAILSNIYHGRVDSCSLIFTVFPS